MRDRDMLVSETLRDRHVMRFSNTDIGSWTWNVHTGALFWSAEHFRICGLEPGSVQPSREMFFELLHPDDRARVEECFDQAVRERAEYKCRYRIVRADRSIRHIDALGRPVLDQSGEPNQFVGTVVDVTEQIRTAALLVENERRFALALDSIPHHVWSLRIDGTLGYWNRQFLEYTGFTPEQLRLRSWDALHPDDIERVQEELRTAIASGTAYEVERRIRGRDGTYRRFLCRGIPVRDQDGRALEYLGTDTDVEDLRLSAEALRAAHVDVARMSRIAILGEVAASLAHELNQPLAAIIANSDALLRWQRSIPPNFEQSALAAEGVQRDARRASAVVENIRAFLQNAQPDRTLVGLADAVREVLDMLIFDLRRHEIEVQVSVPKDLPPVLATRVELQQVLVNLLTNAIESLAHTRTHRRVSIEGACGRQDEVDVVFVVVQDSGPGFSEHDRERLFDAFYTTKTAGLGMGLAISRSIVQRHGGELLARNTPDGPSFEFYLPLPERNGCADALHAQANGIVELT
jgi:PAS domain S-box-containing protein